MIIAITANKQILQQIHFLWAFADLLAFTRFLTPFYTSSLANSTHSYILSIYSLYY